MTQRRKSSNRASRKSLWPFEYSPLFGKGVLRVNITPAILLFAIAFLLYAASLGYGYVLDDETVITENTFVQKGFGGLAEIFGNDSFAGRFQDTDIDLEGGRYRPLSIATFAVEAGLWGPGHPRSSHWINVLLYAFLAVLVFRVLLGWFPASRDAKWYAGIPFWATMFFVVHPLHVEVVANIKGRDEILALLGSLAVIYMSFRYFDTKRIHWLALGAITFFLSLLAKESAIILVAIVPLSLWMFGKVPPARAVQSTWPLWLALLVYLVVRFNVLGFLFNPGTHTDLLNDPFVGMSIGERFATISETLGWYLKLLIFPFPLTSDYYPYHVEPVTWAHWKALIPLIVYTAMTIWAISKIRDRNIIAFCILFYLVSLSVVSNMVFSVGTFMGERFLFTATLPFAILLSYIFSSGIPKTFNAGGRIAGKVAGLIVVLGFGLLTLLRIPAWKDNLSLFSRDVITSANSARAQIMYASTLYQDVYQKEQDPEARKALIDTMEYHIRKGLNIHPEYGMGWMMRAAVEISRFEYIKDETRMFGVLDSTMAAIPYHPDFRELMRTYLPFLATRGGDADLIRDYCYKNGYELFFIQKNDVASARELLEIPVETGIADKRIFTALAEVYLASGASDKASEMQRRAEAAETDINAAR